MFPFILALGQRQRMPRTTQAGHTKGWRNQFTSLNPSPTSGHHVCCKCGRDREERLLGGILLERIVGYYLVQTSTSPPPQKEGWVVTLHFRVRGLKETGPRVKGSLRPTLLLPVLLPAESLSCWIVNVHWVVWLPNLTWKHLWDSLCLVAPVPAEGLTLTWCLINVLINKGKTEEVVK